MTWIVFMGFTSRTSKHIKLPNNNDEQNTQATDLV